MKAVLDIKGVELGGTVKETLVILFEKAEWLKKMQSACNVKDRGVKIAYGEIGKR